MRFLQKHRPQHASSVELEANHVDDLAREQPQKFGLASSSEDTSQPHPSVRKQKSKSKAKSPPALSGSFENRVNSVGQCRSVSALSRQESVPNDAPVSRCLGKRTAISVGNLDLMTATTPRSYLVGSISALGLHNDFAERLDSHRNQRGSGPQATERQNGLRHELISYSKSAATNNASRSEQTLVSTKQRKEGSSPLKRALQACEAAVRREDQAFQRRMALGYTPSFSCKTRTDMKSVPQTMQGLPFGQPPSHHHDIEQKVSVNRRHRCPDTDCVPYPPRRRDELNSTQTQAGYPSLWYRSKECGLEPKINADLDLGDSEGNSYNDQGWDDHGYGQEQVYLDDALYHEWSGEEDRRIWPCNSNDSQPYELVPEYKDWACPDTIHRGLVNDAEYAFSNPQGEAQSGQLWEDDCKELSNSRGKAIDLWRPNRLY